MFGPVFWRELLVATRSSRLHGLRWLFGLFIVAQAFTLFPPPRRGPDGEWTWWHPADVHAHLLVWRLSVQQLLLLLIAAPMLGAHAFTSEKVRGTLLPLLGTALTPAQIVRDKFLAQLTQLLLLYLTGVPFLAIAAAFWDGTPPPLLVVAIATVGPLCALTAAGILASVWCRTTTEALIATYLLLAGAVAAVQWGGEFIRPLGPGYLLDPAVMVPDLPDLVPKTASSGVLPDVSPIAWRMATSALFWGATTLTCLSLAAWRLRPAYLAQLAAHRSARRGWLRLRPPVGDRPIFWREFYRKGLIPLPLLRGWPSYLLWIAVTGGATAVGIALFGQHRTAAVYLVFTLLLAVLVPLLTAVRCTAAVVLDRDPLFWEAVRGTPLPSGSVVWELTHASVAVCVVGVAAAAIPLLTLAALSDMNLFALLVLLGVLVIAVAYLAGAVALLNCFHSNASWSRFMESRLPLFLPLFPILLLGCCTCSCLVPAVPLLISEVHQLGQIHPDLVALVCLVALGGVPILFLGTAGYLTDAENQLERLRAVVPERKRTQQPRPTFDNIPPAEGVPDSADWENRWE